MRIAVFLLTLFLIPNRADAFGKKERGTSGAVFLKLPVGGRAAALGEAYSALADDVYSVYYNPAGLGHVRSVQAAGMHNSHFQSISHNFGAIAVPVLSFVDTRRARNELGVLAFSITSLSVSEIERRANVETDDPIDTFGAGDFAYTAGYGLNLNEHWSAGGAVKFISQTIDSVNASAYALDAGAQYRQDKIRAAAGIRNLGSNVKFRSRSNPIPLGFYAGGSYAFSERWISSVELGIARDDAAVVGVGGEYRRELLKGVGGALRFGYNTATAQADGFGGVALGGGLEYGKTTFDLAWIPYGDLGDTFRFSVLMKF